MPLFRYAKPTEPPAAQVARPSSVPLMRGHRAAQKREPRFVLAVLCVGCLALAACTRTLVPVTAIVKPTSSPTTVSPTIVVEPGPTLRPTEPISAGLAYAVAWVPGGETLAVRQPAGTSGSKIDELSSDQRGIQLTGNSTLLGSSLWVEILRSGGGSGWVNSWNLTEAVSASDFCADPRVQALIDQVKTAVEERDGAALAELISPRRGLVVRLDWWNPDVVIPYSAIPNVLTSPTIVEWGIEQESGEPVEGTFREMILPGLDDVLEGDPTISCDSLNAGRTARSAQWPDEFTNINFYSFFRPPNVPGNELSWRAWAMGIEYVGGEPYLSLLVQYRAEI
jgi:hypothetical protein